MEEEEVEEASEGGKFDAEKLKEKLKNIDWKNKKVIGGLVGILLILIVLLLLVFSGGETKKEEEVSEPKIDFSALGRAKSYMKLLASADSKTDVFMATIRSDDRALQFSMYLGIDQEETPEELKKAMTPLCSEVLRFLSQKSQIQILEMIQDPDEEGKTVLITNLNKILRRRGLSADKVMIVEIQFTKYFFPNI